MVLVEPSLPRRHTVLFSWLIEDVLASPVRAYGRFNTSDLESLGTPSYAIPEMVNELAPIGTNHVVTPLPVFPVPPVLQWYFDDTVTVRDSVLSVSGQSPAEVQLDSDGSQSSQRRISQRNRVPSLRYR